jgi:hypothetical protein
MIVIYPSFHFQKAGWQSTLPSYQAPFHLARLKARFKFKCGDPAVTLARILIPHRSISRSRLHMPSKDRTPGHSGTPSRE